MLSALDLVEVWNDEITNLHFLRSVSMKTSKFDFFRLGLIILASFFSLVASGASVVSTDNFELFDVNQFKYPITVHHMDMQYLQSEGIELNLHANALDPHINFYREFNASDFGSFILSANALPSQTLELFWAGSECSSILEACKVVIPSPSIGSDWEAQLSDHPLWKGNIKQLRIDFSLSGEKPFLLTSISLKAANPVAISTYAQKNNSVSPEKTQPKQISKEFYQIQTNMFSIDLLEIGKFKRNKVGGGLSGNDTEIILITGDGKLSLFDLQSKQAFRSLIEPPANNEEKAMSVARTLESETASKKAVENITNYLRYDDILVFDDQNFRYLVVSYSHFELTNECFSQKVSLLRTSKDIKLKSLEANPSDWDLIYSSAPCFGFKQQGHPFGGHQSGGRLDVFDKENGDIVLALGDFTFDGIGGTPFYSQDSSVDYGKTIKINIHSREAEILSVGHRNTQGIKVADDGQIWSVEHGPQGGDELNRIKRGANYGWPYVTLGIQYGGSPWPFNPSQGRHKKYESPSFAWVPSIGISNLDQSKGFHPFWDGDLLVFSLIGNSIFRLRLNENYVVFSEQVEFPIKIRVRYGFNHEPSGAIYLWADNGKLYKVSPSEDAWELLEKSKKSYAAYQEGFIQTISKFEQTLFRCLECHSGGSRNPPDLHGIIGKSIAGSTYNAYSAALKNKKGMWTEQNLRAFLMHPQDFAPENSMPDQRINSEESVTEIINALKKLKR